MRGQHLLSANGIRSRINRNTAKNSKTGCGYVLSVSESDKATAEKILSANGIRIAMPVPMRSEIQPIPDAVLISFHCRLPNGFMIHVVLLRNSSVLLRKTGSSSLQAALFL